MFQNGPQMATFVGSIGNKSLQVGKSKINLAKKLPLVGIEPECLVFYSDALVTELTWILIWSCSIAFSPKVNWCTNKSEVKYLSINTCLVRKASG